MQYKQQAVSLLIADDRSETASSHGASPALQPPADGFHIAAFHGARQAVFVVSSLDDADVQEVAQAMAEPIGRVLA